jgi:hypothetical protein
MFRKASASDINPFGKLFLKIEMFRKATNKLCNIQPIYQWLSESFAKVNNMFPKYLYIMLKNISKKLSAI